MSGNITLQELRDSCKDRADMVNSTRIPDSTWLEYINKSKDRLYDRIISAYDSEYYTISQDISVVNGTNTYALPNDYYKTVLLEYVIDSTHSYPLKKFFFNEKNAGVLPLGYRRYGTNLKYREVADNLILHPTPTANCTLRLWYIPLATNLTEDDDELKGFNGWEEWIILDVAIKAARSEETDTKDLERDLARINEDLLKMIQNRNIGQTGKIQNVERAFNYSSIDDQDWW